ncbi:hypothetical protein TWF694_006802 [Orbilia ellipsospora]|uniref:Transposase n=1 Tax=Orbilia ellipsospora TaxID=2528407 RepID=A0AAV9XLM7_9PEZI
MYELRRARKLHFPSGQVSHARLDKTNSDWQGAVDAQEAISVAGIPPNKRATSSIRDTLWHRTVCKGAQVWKM